MPPTKPFAAASPIAVVLAVLVALTAPQAALAADSLTAGGFGAGLSAQSSRQDNIFEGDDRFDCQAAVLGVSTGAVHYDKSTRTLTLSNVTAESAQLGALHSITATSTLKLVGAFEGWRNGRYLTGFTEATFQGGIAATDPHSALRSGLDARASASPAFPTSTARRNTAADARESASGSPIIPSMLCLTVAGRRSPFLLNCPR